MPRYCKLFEYHFWHNTHDHVSAKCLADNEEQAAAGMFAAMALLGYENLDVWKLDIMEVSESYLAQIDHKIGFDFRVNKDAKRAIK